MKILKKIFLGLLVLFVVLQFFTPKKNIAHTNHDLTFITETRPTNEVRDLLTTSCYDCHSNHTEYPWYNNVAPVSFWISGHIAEGKEHLNFSEWNALSNKQKAHKLKELITEVTEKKMPLPSYTWIHGDAKLTDIEIDSIIAWANKTLILYQLNALPN
ncbi:heme-binding domain-containing protein [Maribacter sp. CXY002]|uniref:heme-binding domain-containing protein n=1 Tax=Maribacter luteocoastalis TaxID=3407671 RepID=UPI003B6800AD